MSKEEEELDFKFDSDSESEQEEVSKVPFIDEELLKDSSCEANIHLFTDALDNLEFRKLQDEEDRDHTYFEDNYDFPGNPENWIEDDLQEF